MSDVFIGEKIVKISKPILLTVQFENFQFIVSNDELGLLSVGESLDTAINEIKKEFSELWNDYVLCEEEELAKSGIIFRNKLKEYIDDFF